MGFYSDIIAVQKWWMGELQTLTEKVLKEEAKRQAKQREQAEKSLGDLRTYNDVQEAYGVGVISEKKRDRLMDQIEKLEQASWPNRQYEMKLDLLRELYATAKKIVEDEEGRNHDE